MEIQRSSVWIAAFILLLVIAGLVKPDEKCRDIVRYITYSEGISFEINPKIVGEWTSSRCEVRPGPRFLIRHIKIYSNSTWEGRFYRYSDPVCSKPTLAILLTGSYRLRGETKRLKGATSASFNFNRIEIYPYTKKAEHAINKTSSRSCPGQVSYLRNASNANNIYLAKNSAFSKRSCRTEFGISEYEFSVLKLEKYEKRKSQGDRLYFGEISTLSKPKRRYQPSCYQMPLVRSYAHNCTICSQIKRSSAENPPRLPLKKIPLAMLNGAWGSTTCETQPHGAFLTRYMNFHYDSSSWEGNFYYFLDPHCKKLNFMIYGKGVFFGGKRSSKVKGGANYMFTLNDAKITPYDFATTMLLNTVRDDKCGLSNTWKQGVEQSLKVSKGCSILGIKLPRQEFDLIMIDTNELNQRELYLGQKSSNNALAVSANLRATSYEVPLIECSSFNVELRTPPPKPTRATTKRLGPIFPFFTPSPKKSKTTKKRKNDPSKGTNGQENPKIIVNFRYNTSVTHAHSTLLIITLLLLVSW